MFCMKNMRKLIENTIFFSCFVWKHEKNNYSSHVLYKKYENTIILLMFCMKTREELFFSCFVWKLIWEQLFFSCFVWKNMRTQLFFSCFVWKNMRTIIILLMFCMTKHEKNNSSHVLYDKTWLFFSCFVYKTWEELFFSCFVWKNMRTQLFFSCFVWKNMRRIIVLLILVFSKHEKNNCFVWQNMRRIIVFSYSSHVLYDKTWEE